VHEPHVDEWHRRDVSAWLESRGFRLVRDWVDLPFRTVIADLK
jgi:hypothetical protein